MTRVEGQESGKQQRGKIISLDYDAVFALPGDKCLYCLTDQQRDVLVAMLETVNWKTRWYSTIGTVIDQDVIDDFQGQLGAALMSDVCQEIFDALDAIKEELDDVKDDTGQIRTDTTLIKTNVLTIKANTDLLELHLLAQDTAIGLIATDLTALSAAVALDSAAIAGIALLLGTTSTEVHDVHVVVDEIDEDVDAIEITVNDSATEITETGEDVDNIELLVSKLKTTVNNITIQNNTTNVEIFLAGFDTFASNNLDTTTTKNYARYNALCQGIMDWIYSEIFYVQEQLGAADSDLATIIAAIATGGVSIGLTSHGDGGHTIAAIQTAIESLSDVEALACAMITYLVDKKPSFPAFGAALDTFSPANTNQTVLADVLALALLYYDAFSGYIGNQELEYQLALAANPTDYNCPACGVSAYCSIPQTWDFTLLQKTPWLITRGQLEEGIGVVGTQIPGDLNFGMDMTIFWPTPCTAILTKHIEITHAHLSNVGNSFFIEYSYLLAGVPTVYNRASLSQVLAWPQLDVQSLAIPTPPGSVGVYSIRWCINTLYYAPPGLSSNVSNAAKVTKIRLIT